SSFVFYSKKFLFLRSYSKTLSDAIDLSLSIYGIIFVLNYFLLNVSWVSYLYLLPFALIYLGGMLAWQKGNRSAKYFLMAFSFLIFCFTIFVLRVTGIISTTIFTVYALN